MDPETVKTVGVPLLAGFFALLGVALGGYINDRIARENRATQVALAEQERATKLAMAREEARREWRKQQLSGLLAVANQRPALFTRARTHIRAGQPKEASATLQRLSDAMPLTESSWATFNASPIWKQVSAYIDADTQFTALFGHEPPVVDGPEYVKRGNALIEATRALNEAAEQHIFGAD